jgi:GntR family transcriptional regulator
MEISVDFRSGQPIYVQIVEQIRSQVVAGRLKPGDQLPTVRQMATDLRINFNTVARAYRLLDEAGLISTQQGRGTYIWEAPTEETSRRLRRSNLEALTHRYLSEVARLGCPADEVAETFEKFFSAWQTGDAPQADSAGRDREQELNK